MRVFAVSDIHVDFEENKRWVSGLSKFDYKEDILILAGDVSENKSRHSDTFKQLKERFAQVCFVPGNHDLWVRHANGENSLDKFNSIVSIAEDYGIFMKPVTFGPVAIIPLIGWYDYSFGRPSDELKKIWGDYRACKWPDGFDAQAITKYFISKNDPFPDNNDPVKISFSHFVPRIDLMPFYIPPSKRILYPVLGTSLLEEQIRRLGSHMHIYGHTHVNGRVQKDGIVYVNNAFGYPYEQVITAKRLLCVYE